MLKEGDGRVAPLAVTMGCPAGIGPEIILKAAFRDPYWMRGGIVVYGDRGILERAMEITGIKVPLCNEGGSDLKVKEVTSLSVESVPFGKCSQLTGKASFQYVEAAVKDALEGLVSGVVTAPITKEGLSLAGIPYPGHTEILADLTDTSDYAMMLMGRNLKVVLCTIHCKLRSVPRLLSKGLVQKTIILAHTALKRDFGIDNPRIAVAGLNPHAGEGGLFGDEEEEIILPAIEAARKEHVDCHGPFPPDTVFYRASRGEFHVVVAQYHDQGLIPIKLLHFEDGVNVTLNLPIVRTSVDHGTAYDIAGKGIANSKSLEEAVRVALHIIRCRRRNP